ncbi:MAG: GalU regulator GalF [Alphaproteobacteria bacterium ADurb.Bin438]|nr:MAG: GalU regulator GalF [Alphaproteobacteria bacterium ADurb.Bin438]
MENIEFVILCGGKSVESYPYSKGVVHKCLLPFGSVRIIDYWIKEIEQIGGKYITLVCKSNEIAESLKSALIKDEEIYEVLKVKNQALADNYEKTFLNPMVSIRYAVQKNERGTAHAVGLAHQMSKKRHKVIINPDDIFWSKKEGKSHIKNMIAHFLKNPKQILMSGVRVKDISNVSVLMHGNLIEGIKHSSSDVGCMSPMIFPAKFCDFMLDLANRSDNGEVLLEMSDNGKLYYINVINSFVGKVYEPHHINVFLKDEDIEYIDLSTMEKYQKALIKSLVDYSVYGKENFEYIKELVNK